LNKANSTKWICFQIGAREHYAIPRALNKNGVLKSLYTDLWFSPNQTPAFLSNAKMNSRFHPDLGEANVGSFNMSAYVLQAKNKLVGTQGWAAILERNSWFQRKCLTKIKNLDIPQDSVFFSYSYAAADLFKLAKSRGLTTVLGQIDPGPLEVRLVHEIEREHGAPLTESPPSEYWDRWNMECELSDLIVVNSVWSRDMLLKSGIAEEKIRVVPLVYEASKTTVRSADANQEDNSILKVLYLGQVIARKGVIELIDAVRQLGEGSVEWTIVGGGDPNLLAQLDSFSNVSVTGQVPRNLAEEYYQSNDVFILPTHSDGFAITQLEAFAYGVPIIASKNCGDVVEHMQTGILLDDVDGSSIVRSVETLLKDSEILPQMKKSVRARKLASIEELGKTLIDLVGPVSVSGISDKARATIQNND